MPATVREVCDVLTRAGHQAVTVGGAVRDAVLARDPGDWDVATSAKPDEVVALFKRTIPTGMQHGTVTVLVGRGSERLPVEVTTFRGEGAYSDARRPDHVVFGVPLVEDLARRDLVVNAIAYDPAKDEIIDPFGGIEDIAAKRLRAVGTPEDRFREDGLRVMRAIRFAAVLEFTLDPATEAAIPPALPSLAKVSRERVHDELVKLLAARRPSLGLAIAARTQVLAKILPEVDYGAIVGARVDAAEPHVRLAALLVGSTPAAADGALRRLKFSNEDRELAVKLVGVAEPYPDDMMIRQESFSPIGRAAAADAVRLWRARAAAGEGDKYDESATIGAMVLERGDALVVGELAITGNDLINELGMAPGRAIGEMLADCLHCVLLEPSYNTRETLLEFARTGKLPRDQAR